MKVQVLDYWTRIIEQVHREVDEHRAGIGLPPHDWSKRRKKAPTAAQVRFYERMKTLMQGNWNGIRKKDQNRAEKTRQDAAGRTDTTSDRL